MTTRRHLARSLLVLTALVAASCSGGDDDSPEASATSTPAIATTTIARASTTTSTSVASRPTTTVRPSTTETSDTTTTVAATTTTAAPVPTYPLTGLPIDDELTAYRAAIAVKFDNHPQARPQSGINQADIVFEENVEQLTRFAAVFHSQDADPVGPIRSGRTQDIDLLGSFANPLFVWSGGNANVTRAIRNSDLVDVSWTVAGDRGGFRRIRNRAKDIEHTLFASTPLLSTNFTPLYAPPPPPQFTFRPNGEAPEGTPSSGADVQMDGVAVHWQWDPVFSQYVRDQNGAPHLDSDGFYVNARNVVILEVDYRPSPADRRSPEAQTIGTGVAHVLTGNVAIEGTWQRDDRLEPFTLRDLDGDVIGLTPGRTWVELSRAGSTTVL